MLNSHFFRKPNCSLRHLSWPTACVLAATLMTSLTLTFVTSVASTTCTNDASHQVGQHWQCNNARCTCSCPSGTVEANCHKTASSTATWFPDFEVFVQESCRSEWEQCLSSDYCVSWWGCLADCTALSMPYDKCVETRCGRWQGSGVAVLTLCVKRSCGKK